ncbi:MAG: BrnA antitoxin family protein [Deinococcota bacterium]|nr:BrnA antitoxin family protein [Deinococcota bacterium]
MDKKRPSATPEQFKNYDEAAEFWDTHDTTDYLDEFRTVDLKGELRGRHFEVELEEDVVKALQHKAKEQGVSLGDLASALLRQKLNEAA